MGAISPKYNHHGNIFIQLENSTAFSGQNLAGMIHMNLTSPVSPSTLILVFKGFESTAWVVYRGKRPINRRGYHRICNFNCPIYQWNNPLPIGGYSLPFTFTLPENMPGSLNSSGRGYKAKIEYKLFAKLMSRNNENLKAAIPIHIIETNFPLQANVSVSRTAVLTTWCCIGQGTSSINVVFPQDMYNASQVAIVNARIDNSLSNLDVVGVSCRLSYSLRLRSNAGWSHFVNREITSGYFPVNIPAGTSPKNTSPVQMQINLPAFMSTLNRMHSTEGKLITCTYHVVVKAHMNSLFICCGNLPTTETIMKIVPTEFDLPTLPPPPMHWNPVMLNPVALQYDARYEVPKQQKLVGFLVKS